MKRDKLFKTGGIYLAIMMLAASFLSSCLKDNGPGSVDFSKSPALVGFQYQAGGPVPITTKLLGHAGDTASVEITLSVASITLKSPVTVTVAHDAAGEAAYVADNTDSQILPASDYTIPNGGKITINPGQQIVRLKLTYKGDQIDFDNNYIVGLKITDAQGAVVASNLNKAILLITLKSIYEGEYSMNGYIIRHTGNTFDTKLSGNFSTQTGLNTVNQYAVSLSQIWADKTAVGGVDVISLSVDQSTNKVTIVSSTNAGLGNVPGYNSHYDPSTKTFYVSFQWFSGSDARVATDTLTYLHGL